MLPQLLLSICVMKWVRDMVHGVPASLNSTMVVLLPVVLTIVGSYQYANFAECMVRECCWDVQHQHT